jgi:phosphoribosylamine--glycine ligase
VGLRVVEFNARFGDPETQVVLARLRTPLAGLLAATAAGRLDEVAPLRWHPGAAVTVVVAAAGYPGSPKVGDPVDGLTEAAAVEGAYVLHAGTRSVPEGGVVSAGGRVLSVVGTGPDLVVARERAYEAAARIRLEGGHYRTDIADSAAAGSPPPVA